MKIIKKKFKQKFNRLLRLAHQNDLTLNSYIELIQRFNESKRNQRLVKRYGESPDWTNAESDEVFGLIVPMVLNVKNEIVSFWAVNDIDNVPDKYKHLWGRATGDRLDT